MKPSLLALLLLAPATFLVAPAMVDDADAAALEGRIVNETTGQPARVERIEVIDVAQGMAPLATLENVDGQFRFEDVPTESSAHLLLQVTYAGVTTSQSLNGVEGPLEVKVYETTDAIDAVTLARHHVLFQREGDHMLVTELMEYANRTDPPMSVAAASMPMRLWLGNPVHGEITASVGSGQMPVTKQLMPVPGADLVQGVEQALPPGTTRMIVRYNFEYHDGAATWKSTAIYPTEDRRILVAPTDVDVTVDQMISTESPLEGFAAWAGLQLAAGETWQVSLAGGSATAEVHNHPTTPAAGQQVTSVAVRPNRLSNNGVLLALGLAAALSFGLLMGLSRSKATVALDAQEALAVDEKRLRVSNLADRYISGEITREQFERDRDAILRGKAPHAQTNGAAKRVETASH